MLSQNIKVKKAYVVFLGSVVILLLFIVIPVEALKS
jgi:hypothetical protein